MNTKCIALMLYLILLQTKSTYSDDSCRWSRQTNQNDQPEIYYINIDKSKERRAAMEEHLSHTGLKYTRSRGVSFEVDKDVFISDYIASKIASPDCVYHNDSYISDLKYNKQKYAITGLCGKEVAAFGCTASHLIAIRRAIDSQTSTSKYAIILEDDLIFPFEVDFTQLIETAPNDFARLKLYLIHAKAVDKLFNLYLDTKQLWQPRSEHHWSSGAYILDKEKLKPYIDAMVSFNTYTQVTELKLIAASERPVCRPKECCSSSSSALNPTSTTYGSKQDTQQMNHTFTNRDHLACLHSSSIAADYLLFALGKTYTLTIPILTGGKGSDKSDLHQSHVGLIHKKAYANQKKHMMYMYTHNDTMPSFLKSTCKLPFSVHE